MRAARMLWEALPVATMAVKPDWGGEEGPVCTYARTTTRMIGCSGPADALELLSHAVCQACNHSLHCELVGQGAGTIALWGGGRAVTETPRTILGGYWPLEVFGASGAGYELLCRFVRQRKNFCFLEKKK